MIKHIVMWKLKDQAEGADRAANAARMKALLDGCRDIVPGIVEFEVALAGAGLEATYDVVLYAVFADKAALDAYQDVRLERQCMDYEA
jgi:Stress responsive A/B Barrel Domain